MGTEIILDEFGNEITNTNEEKEITESITEKLLSDNTLADNLNDIATSATKTISTKEDGTITVPDYSTRLKALEMELKMKGHFDPKGKGNELPPGIYIFSK